VRVKAGHRQGGRNSSAERFTNRPGYRPACSPTDPGSTGTCLLRRFSGSTDSMTEGRAAKTAKPGVRR
jgi:hypothetical protein